MCGYLVMERLTWRCQLFKSAACRSVMRDEVRGRLTPTYIAGPVGDIGRAFVGSAQGALAARPSDAAHRQWDRAALKDHGPDRERLVVARDR
jgi:hypothetical protein